MLGLKELELKYSNQNKIFENISYNFKKNKSILLTGPSGSGKSSLLMAIAGIVPKLIPGKLKGQIFYHGINLKTYTLNEILGEIAYVFQDAESQLCTFTVKEELAFGLENLCRKPEEICIEINCYLKQFGILNLKDKKISELSGGQKQVVALVASLIMQPKILLLDEPTANLDIEMTQKVLSVLKEIKKKDTLIILIEHKVREFLPLVDEVLWLEKNNLYSFSVEKFQEKVRQMPQLKKWEMKNEKTDIVMESSNLNFSYGENKTLKDINFKLYKGEVVSIVGHNGAGKTTLSKLMMGILKPTTGNMIIEGKKIKRLTPLEIGKKMGISFQNPEHQFIKMTVEDELKLGLVLAGYGKEVVAEKVEKYLKKFKLTEQRYMNPFLLSQGQKRRLSTASMLIGDQKILILDEPTYGQDRENLIELMDMLEKFQEKDRAILMITHDLELVEKCCHRVIQLENGKIIFDGTREIFLEKGY